MREHELYENYIVLEEYHYGYRKDDILLPLYSSKKLYEAFNEKDIAYIAEKLKIPFPFEIRKYNLLEFRLMHDMEDMEHISFLVCFGVYPDLQEDSYKDSDLQEWNSVRPKRSVRFPCISEYDYLTFPQEPTIISGLYDRSELFKHDEQNVRAGKLKKICFEYWFNRTEEQKLAEDILPLFAEKNTDIVDMVK